MHPTPGPYAVPDGFSYEVGVTWDVVGVDRAVGLAAVVILGPRCGAVIDDAQCLYWLVAPGAAAGWPVAGGQVLSDGTVAVPPLRWSAGPGAFWRVCPGDSDWTTSADALRAAVEDAAARLVSRP
ncbi:hypothetical protein [Streptomyces sp. NPDC053560]|uniref:hypothetical protein n=1 Tax=Streptomyces sp. NPDC053560 TaxID=3365711 RepID=UPI0037CF774D